MILLLFLAIVEYLIYIFCLRSAWDCGEEGGAISSLPGSFTFCWSFDYPPQIPSVWHVAPAAAAAAGVAATFCMFDRFRQFYFQLQRKLPTNMKIYLAPTGELRFETGLLSEPEFVALSESEILTQQ